MLFFVRRFKYSGTLIHTPPTHKHTHLNTWNVGVDHSSNDAEPSNIYRICGMSNFLFMAPLYAAAWLEWMRFLCYWIDHSTTFIPTHFIPAKFDFVIRFWKETVISYVPTWFFHDLFFNVKCPLLKQFAAKVFNILWIKYPQIRRVFGDFWKIRGHSSPIKVISPNINSILYQKPNVLQIWENLIHILIYFRRNFFFIEDFTLKNLKTGYVNCFWWSTQKQQKTLHSISLHRPWSSHKLTILRIWRSKKKYKKTLAHSANQKTEHSSLVTRNYEFSNVVHRTNENMKNVQWNEFQGEVWAKKTIISSCTHVNFSRFFFIIDG